ncbi:MAG: Gldg family protein, partial [Bdellovibrionales bacterium]|nr:Gldg family protein [Bdellovibrionales bacterium]
LPSGERLFFGLAGTNAFGEEAAVPLFNMQRQEFLEYDVTKLIHSLSTSEKPKIGIITPLDIEGQPTPPPMPGMPPQEPRESWIMVNQLKNIADVEFLGTDVTEVKEDIDVLMVIFPQNLPEQTRYAIDQFAVKGGNLFVAVDPFCSVFQPKTDPQNPFAQMSADRSASLDLLAGWGVSLVDDVVLADINLATQVGTRQGGPVQQFPLWLTLSSANGADEQEWIVNPDEITTSELETLMLPWPGALKIEAKEGVTVTPLLRSTAAAMLFPENDVRFGGDDPQQVLKKYKRGSERQVMAVRLSGKLKSNFANKPGKDTAEATMSTEGGHVPEGTEAANVVVVADVDFLADSYSAQAQNLFGARLVTLLNDNLIFAVNTAENLTGSDDLISLRSRGQFSRPFTTVQAVEAQAQERWKQEEMIFQQKLDEANKRLTQLQSGAESSGGRQAFSSALLEEVKQFREERKVAREKLREVRRRLREDKEQLGSILFAVNTFLVPIVLIVLSIVLYRRKSSRLATARVQDRAEKGAHHDEA